MKPGKWLLGFFSIAMIVIVLLAVAYEKASEPVFVKPDFALTVAGTPVDGVFDYCKPPSTPVPSISFAEGTPVAMTPVVIGADWSDTPVPMVIAQIATPIPPTAIPTPDIALVNPVVIDGVGFNDRNYHVIMVPVGYKESEVDSEMSKLMTDLEGRFKGVNIDFGYINAPIDIPLNFIGVRVYPQNPDDVQRLLQKVRLKNPTDSLVVALKTNQILGTSYNGQNYAIFTLNNPLGWFIAAHEIGHQLSLRDGYQDYFLPGKLPSTELFFGDSMTEQMARALKELGKIPPVYLVGTCNGHSVYRFYNGQNDIYANYNFDPSKVPNSWGDTTFTPLQIQIMNDYVSDLRGK